MLQALKKNGMAFAALGFVFATVIFYEPARMTLYRVMHNCAYPFIQVGSAIGQPIGNYFQRRATLKELLEQNKNLTEQVENLTTQTVQLAASLSFLERSSELAQFQQRYNLTDALMGKILEKQLDSHEHSFLLNVGNRDGVTTNMVALYKTQLIGKVVEVYECYSKLLLITDRNCKVAAHTKTGNYVGIVQGENKLNHTIFTYVSKLADITPHDFVISSGEGLLFPEGMCLGTIDSIETKELYHHIGLKTTIEFDSIGFCLLTHQEAIKGF